MIASSTHIRFGPRPNAPARRYRYVTALCYDKALRNGPYPLVTETISADHMFWLPGWLPVGIPRIPTRTTYGATRGPLSRPTVMIRQSWRAEGSVPYGTEDYGDADR